MSGLSRFGRAVSFTVLIVIIQIGLFSHAGAQVATTTVALTGRPRLAPVQISRILGRPRSTTMDKPLL
jgi:hypothetical protein